MAAVGLEANLDGVFETYHAFHIRTICRTPSGQFPMHF